MSVRRTLLAALATVVVAGSGLLAAPAHAADTTRPTIHVTKPPVATRAEVSAWQVVHGTSHDTGSGVGLVSLQVLERRDGRWFSYSFAKKRWIRGFIALQRTIDANQAYPALTNAKADGTWRTPAIHHLRQGKLFLRALAWDKAGNTSRTVEVAQVLTKP